MKCRRDAWRELLHSGGAVVEHIFASWDALTMLTDLQRGSEGVFLAGGSVRDFVVGSPSSDIDLIVPNGDSFVDQVLEKYGSCKVNRHGNRHYRLGNGLKVDVIEPRLFYRPFGSASEALRYFDASVNAIGIDVSSGRVLDPLNGSNDLVRGLVRLPTERWSSMGEFEGVHLLLRLCRLLERHNLRVVNTDCAESIAPLVWRVDWSDLGRLHGFSREVAARRIDSFILQRPKVNL